MIYGRLDEPQRSALRRQIEQSIFDPQRILAERQRRQQDVLQTLRQLAGQPVASGEARAPDARACSSGPRSRRIPPTAACSRR